MAVPRLRLQTLARKWTLKQVQGDELGDARSTTELTVTATAARPPPSTFRSPGATLRRMREKELRLALVCYGGISLAIYMHGVTKEIWHLARASCAFHDGSEPGTQVEAVYRKLFELIQSSTEIKLRVLADIVAGASAGGINGIFLSHAIATGQSLDPLTDMWLENADVDQLLDPDARPISSFTKFWATPIAWLAIGRRGGGVERTVTEEGRKEVRSKLSRFVRARWFEPPFGGAGFTGMLLDAFDAMAKTKVAKRLLPAAQPLDLFVTVTDFSGHPETLRLNSPSHVIETEHRLTMSFSDRGVRGTHFDDAVALTFAARATASFPGAFPPLNVTEMDRVLAGRKRAWAGRSEFLARALPGSAKDAESAILIDGSVLANAPFRPAIEALRDRPSRREVDRRFVYIDPKPGMRSVRLTKKGDAELPGFLATIFGAMSDIPREQPIRDSLEAIEGRSFRIRRMQRIVDALRPDVEAAIEAMFGRTFFLDSPTPARLKNWRSKAQERAARDAGYAYAAYGHAKLSSVVEEIVSLAARQNPELRGDKLDSLRQSMWEEVRARGVDHISDGVGKGASPAAIVFFRAHDLRFRIRRLRFVLRAVDVLQNQGHVANDDVEPLREAIFKLLSSYLDREGVGFYQSLNHESAAALLDDLEAQRDLTGLDTAIDAEFAQALGTCPKSSRRSILYAYLGFPFYDLTTLPMLQGEGLDEFDPIKVDRISPEDATAIRSGVAATLKGIQFNSFGAFFSRTYRENDYLWGRLHGADRLFDIVISSAGLDPVAADGLKRELLYAVLEEERPRLLNIPDLFETLQREIAAGPVAA
jgi:patatin-related protein